MERSKVLAQSNSMGLRQFSARDAIWATCEVECSTDAVDRFGSFRVEGFRRKTWYRMIYLARIEDTIYVLHCFEKGSAKPSEKT